MPTAIFMDFGRLLSNLDILGRPKGRLFVFAAFHVLQLNTLES